jgi:hypothetical protein
MHRNNHFSRGIKRKACTMELVKKMAPQGVIDFGDHPPLFIFTMEN